MNKDHFIGFVVGAWSVLFSYGIWTHFANVNLVASIIISGYIGALVILVSDLL